MTNLVWNVAKNPTTPVETLNLLATDEDEEKGILCFL